MNLISREDAIEAVYEALRTPLPDYKNDFFHDSMSLAISIVKNIPSAEPERKTGKWSSYKDEHCCSVCHCVVIQKDWSDENQYDFCPYCGAEMEGEE